VRKETTAELRIVQKQLDELAQLVRDLRGNEQTDHEYERTRQKGAPGRVVRKRWVTHAYQMDTLGRAVQHINSALKMVSDACEQEG